MIEDASPLLEPGDLVFQPEEVRALWKKLDESVPAEKERARREGIAIARDLEAEGGHKFDGGGQKMGSIDLRTYIRWQQEFPGCWQDSAFVDRFLKDNPQYLAPGYRPAPPPKIALSR